MAPFPGQLKAQQLADQETVVDGKAVVPCVFKLGRHCNFGEHWAVVGNAEELGNWNPDHAVPMTWTPGDIWVAVVHLPKGMAVEYKHVLVSADGSSMVWEGEEGDTNCIIRITPGFSHLVGHMVEVHSYVPVEYATFSSLPPVSAQPEEGKEREKAGQQGGSQESTSTPWS
jgi:hypothetical protein